MSTELETFSVSELNDLSKDALKKSLPKYFFVKGEVSGMQNSRGNIYFTLKDNDASVKAVIWKSTYDAIKKNGELMNGDKITVKSCVDLYVKFGSYQIQIFSYKKNGLGEIHEKYLALKSKFEDKGYFDDKRKKKLPEIIKSIGLVTSKTGDALQDILRILKDGKFQGKVHIKNTLVQGIDCPESVVEGINHFQEKVDVIVLARGGGSFEDLIGFSSKIVINSIFLSKTPIISAIGHERDHMLSDFVADLRCATPTAAAQHICAHNKNYWDLQLVEFDLDKVKHRIHNYTKNLSNELKEKNEKIINLCFVVADKKHKTLIAWESARASFKERIEKFIDRFENLQKIICALDPKNKIKDGTAIVTSLDGLIIKSAEELKDKQKIIIIFSDGSKKHVKLY